MRRAPLLLSFLLFALIPTPPLAATDTTAAQLEKAAQSLDQTIAHEKLTPLTPKLARLLDEKAEVVEKALLRQRRKLSEIAFAHLVAEKSGKTCAEVLAATPRGPWPPVLKAAGVEFEHAKDFLETLEGRVAALVLDDFQKK